MSNVISRQFLSWAALAALTLILVLAGADPAGAGTFNPELTAEIHDPTPEASSDYTIDFAIPESDVNFAGVVVFVPIDWGIVPGSQIPIGTSVGKLDSTATLGLFNAPCNQELLVSFAFKNGTVDTTETVSYVDADKNFHPDFVEDKNNDGNPDAIDKYPDWLTRMFPDLQPITRSVGLTSVAGIPIILQLLIFPPGTKVNDEIPDDESLGYPTVVVLMNIGDPGAVPQPFAITDFCTPLTSTTDVPGKSPDGVILAMNPKAGVYDFTAVAVGQPDADGDGLENFLDTCPFQKNVGSPRVSYDGDADSDGLDAACDPDDNVTDSDEDLDGYQNRLDNCPLIPNGEDGTNQADDDLDQIGNECDTHPDQRDGELPVVQITKEVTIGGGGPGGPPSDQACPDCYHPGEASSATQNSGGGLGAGALIGIFVGVAAVVVVAGGAVYVTRRRRA